MARFRLLGWIAAGTATVLTATACGSDGGSPGHPVDGATVSVATSEDFGNLDPQSTNLKQSIAIARYAYDPPVTLDNDQKLQPGIVTEWSGDGTTYDLTVRDGVTCSEGDAMSAQVVADNINYVADPENGSPLLGMAVPRGAKATADEAAGTVRVSLAEKSSFFVENLSVLPLVCRLGWPTGSFSRRRAPARVRTSWRRSSRGSASSTRCARATRGARRVTRPPM